VTRHATRPLRPRPSRDAGSLLGLAPDDEKVPLLSPAQGNVCFASAFHGWCFSLSSYARVYTDRLAAQVVSRSQIAATPSILSRATTTSYSRHKRARDDACRPDEFHITRATHTGRS
jgi:hypothetical protein